MHSSCDAYRPLLSVFLCIHSACIIELQLCAKHCVLGIEATVVIQVASLYSNGAHTLMCVLWVGEVGGEVRGSQTINKETSSMCKIPGPARFTTVIRVIDMV